MIGKEKILLACCIFFAADILHLPGCTDREPEQRPARKPDDYIKPIPGPNTDTISKEAAQKGEVLISYSDCYICHKENKKSIGPAFKDIAKRYPTNKAYIDYLAKKVISGGSRSWGFSVMSAHPKLSPEDARLMISYILSLRE